MSELPKFESDDEEAKFWSHPERADIIDNCGDIRHAAVKFRSGMADFVILRNARWFCYRLKPEHCQYQARVRDLTKKLRPRLIEVSIA